MVDDDRKESGRRHPRFPVQSTTFLWPESSGGVRSIRTQTRNISRSGLLVQGNFSEEIGSHLRFEVELPAPMGGKQGCLLRGRARLVRFEEFAGGRVGFGAEIEHYEIAPPRRTETVEPKKKASTS